MSQPINRRQALLTAASAVLAAGFSKRPVRAAEETEARQPICVFTKPFNSLSFDQLAESAAALGFDGIEAPIRQGGHIEPAEADDRLPALAEALRKRDLEITVLASDINDPNDPLTFKVLRTAARLGIKRYRMKYLTQTESRDL